MSDHFTTNYFRVEIFDAMNEKTVCVLPASKVEVKFDTEKSLHVDTALTKDILKLETIIAKHNYINVQIYQTRGLRDTSVVLGFRYSGVEYLPVINLDANSNDGVAMGRFIFTKLKLIHKDIVTETESIVESLF